MLCPLRGSSGLCLGGICVGPSVDPGLNVVFRCSSSGWHKGLAAPWLCAPVQGRAGDRGDAV